MKDTEEKILEKTGTPDQETEKDGGDLSEREAPVFPRTVLGQTAGSAREN